MFVFFLSVVMWVRRVSIAGPASCEQTQLILRRPNSVVVRLVLWNRQVAARKTGIRWVFAVGLGVVLVRTVAALNFGAWLATVAFCDSPC